MLPCDTNYGSKTSLRKNDTKCFSFSASALGRNAQMSMPISDRLYFVNDACVTVID